MTSRAGYWIGGGLMAIAVVAAIGWAAISFVGLADTVDSFLRVPAPGSQTIQLEARQYTVYLEGPGADDGAAPPVQFTIADADGGDRALAVTSYGGSLTYSFGGHSGTAQATVMPPRAGRYVVRTRTGLGRGTGLGVALGESVGGRIVRAIVGALVIGAVLGIAGIGLIAATAVRRNRRPPPAGLAGPDG